MSLTLSHVTFGYRAGIPILQDVNLALAGGELTGVVGASGAGKSTLLHLLAGHLAPQAGRIERHWVEDEIRWIFQMPTVLGRRTVVDNVLIGMRSDRRQSSAMAVLGKLGLGGLEGRKAASLSGGQLQRVQVARALGGKPKLILADEPTGQLDRGSAEMVRAAFQAACDEGTTLVIATHDRELLKSCHRVLHIADGRLQRSRLT